MLIYAHTVVLMSIFPDYTSGVKMEDLDPHPEMEDAEQLLATKEASMKLMEKKVFSAVHRITVYTLLLYTLYAPYWFFHSSISISISC